jgi:hypothetical protein
MGPSVRFAPDSAIFDEVEAYVVGATLLVAAASHF